MKKNLAVGLLLSMLFLGRARGATRSAGSLDVHWDEGAEDCEKTTARRCRFINTSRRRIILRQSLCSNFEAPLMYLLIGDDEALLIDTGAVEDAAKMPLAQTVLELLPSRRRRRRFRCWCCILTGTAIIAPPMRSSPAHPGVVVVPPEVEHLRTALEPAAMARRRRRTSHSAAAPSM